MIIDLIFFFRQNVQIARLADDGGVLLDVLPGQAHWLAAGLFSGCKSLQPRKGSCTSKKSKNDRLIDVHILWIYKNLIFFSFRNTAIEWREKCVGDISPLSSSM